MSSANVAATGETLRGLVRLLDVSVVGFAVFGTFLNAFAELLRRVTYRACEQWELRRTEQEQDHDENQDDHGATDVS
jgi:hypothetical protein